jgi:hypothetical protein
MDTQTLIDALENDMVEEAECLLEELGNLKSKQLYLF